MEFLPEKFFGLRVGPLKRSHVIVHERVYRLYRSSLPDPPIPWGGHLAHPLAMGCPSFQSFTPCPWLILALSDSTELVAAPSLLQTLRTGRPLDRPTDAPTRPEVFFRTTAGDGAGGLQGASRPSGGGPKGAPPQERPGLGRSGLKVHGVS